MTTARFFYMTILVAAFAASPARAGFEWKGPVTPPPANFNAEQAPAADSYFPSPVVDGGMTMPAEKVVGVEQQAVMSAPVDNAVSSPAPEALTSTQSAGGETLAGFGSDLPLAIALQQVVPAGYQYSFGAGVDPGAPVSWQGGKNWQGVLTDMLAAKGLGFTQKGNTIMVGYGLASGMQSATTTTTTVTTSELPPVSGVEFYSADSAPVALAPAAVPAPCTPDMSVLAPAPYGADKNQGAFAPGLKQVETVSIRRQRPSSLLGHLNRTDRTYAQGQVADVPQGIFDGTVYNRTPAEKAAGASQVMSAPAAMPDDNAPVSILPPVSATPTFSADEPVQQSFRPDAVTGEPTMVDPSWHGTRGQTLRDVLKSWSDVAGVDLYWSIDYDYRLNEDIAFAGTYDEAAGKLLDKFSNVRPQPYGQLHQSADGPRVLVVKSYDLTN